MFRKISYCILLFLFMAGLLWTGCGQKESGFSPDSVSVNKTKQSSHTSSGHIRDNTPQVLVPEASGKKVLGNDTAAIDVSNAQEGYVMVRYTGTNPKVKLLITTPDGTSYPYLLHPENGYETFPLSSGDGTYQLQIYENIRDDRYSTLDSESLDVVLKDEFRPFLYPNQYVWFTSDTKAVKKAAQLTEGAPDDLTALTNIYHYVIDTVSYDEEAADSVSANYLPDVDVTLKTEKGICFDYASLLAVMLRSQGIPTKLEIGYSGDVYHAWISAYLAEIGWVDSIIEFDGKSWSLMDPTLAASNSTKNVGKYIGDGSNYTVKYIR